MTIRTYGAGDDVAQVSIYNEVAAALPKFKPATVDEVRRRCRAPDFDPSTRFVAVADGRPVGYATFQANGRVSFPWCRKGHESWAEPLLAKVLQTMKERGLPRAFAAYRADWAPLREFFLGHGFQQTREMINYVMDLVEMPTPAARPSTSITPLRREDVPALYKLKPDMLRVSGAAEFEQHLYQNPYFAPESVFVLRSRADGAPLAAGVVVTNPAYAHPKQVDPWMPCFRLGAFGTEGQNTKRINGLFSFLTGEVREVSAMGLDLLGYAAFRLQDTDVETFSAQVASDVAYLVRFYKQYFRRQGSFPLYERTL